jgi:hypothetical protein
MGGYGGVVLALVRTHVATSALLLIVVCICSFLVIKVMLGVNLVSYAAQRRAGMETRAAADAVNDFGRNPIGEGKEEQVRLCFITIALLSSVNSSMHFLSGMKVYNKELRTLLDNERDDAPRTAEMGENKPGQRGKKGRVPLEELTRYTMVKRIW